MKFLRLSRLLLIGFSFLGAAVAQQSSQPAEITVPRLVNFSGRVRDAQGKAVSGIASVTFAIYQDQYDGAPLWLETQNVPIDARGNYTVQLGATRSQGLPLDVFISGEARWLGVRVNGQEEQPRVVLLSVPYALKAADAATIGGLPPSAFVLAPAANANINVTSSSSTANLAGNPMNPNLGGTGTLDFVPLWTPDGNTLGNSVLFQSGTQIGVNTTTPAATLDVNGPMISRGVLQLLSTGTATAGAGFSSQPLYLQGSAFNSSTQQAISPVFQWQTEPAGNDTSNPAGTLNLLYGTGAGLPSETGLNIASNGRITFASGQTFPGTGTITGITAGTGLTGGGSNGNVTLSINVPFANQFYAQLSALNTFTKNQTVNANLSAKQLISTSPQGTAPLQVTSTTQVANLNVSLLGGLTASAFQPAGSYAGLGANTFTGAQNVTGNVTASGAVTGGVVNAMTGFDLGGTVFASGSFLNQNAFLGFAGNSTTTGVANTASGLDALASNSTGLLNTATGAFALFHNTTGNSNTANGSGALQNNSTGGGNTANGGSALTDNITGNQDTATGEGALLSNTTGSNNTASGGEALAFNTTGDSNTATGGGALVGNTTGGQNTASGTFALFNNTTGSFNTALGFQAGPDSRSTNLTNSTAIGANATVTASNAMVLGSINGVNGATADTFVGIGTTAPTHKLHVGTGNNAFRVEGPPQGTSSPIVASFGGTGDFRIDAVNVGGGRFLVKDNGFVGINTTAPDATLSVNGSADKPGGGSWATFSDRRLKTLDGNFDAGLSQVLKLHPIRYRYRKDNALGFQDREEHVGFVAQDVQKVIPEAVTENSKGYLLLNNDPILWTMLNAIQEQQREIATLRKQLRQRAAKQAMLESRLVRLEHDREEKTKVALARQTR